MASGSISDINSFLDPKTEEKGQYFVDQATGQYYYQVPRLKHFRGVIYTSAK
jgi:hypothetical protein